MPFLLHVVGTPLPDKKVTDTNSENPRPTAKRYKFIMSRNVNQDNSTQTYLATA